MMLNGQYTNNPVENKMKEDNIDHALELVSKIEEMLRIKQPLFEATINERGQIVIPEWVRKRYGYDPQSRVAVYQIEKVDI